jgi:hypothetical protein
MEGRWSEAETKDKLVLSYSVLPILMTQVTVNLVNYIIMMHLHLDLDMEKLRKGFSSMQKKCRLVAVAHNQDEPVYG